ADGRDIDTGRVNSASWLPAVSIRIALTALVPTSIPTRQLRAMLASLADRPDANTRAERAVRARNRRRIRHESTTAYWLRGRPGAPFTRRRAVLPGKQPGEIAGIGDPDSPGDIVNRQLGLRQQQTRFGHPTVDDPLLHGAPGATAHHGGQVSRCHRQLGGHVTKRQRLAATAVDHGEYVGQERVTAAPQM